MNKRSVFFDEFTEITYELGRYTTGYLAKSKAPLLWSCLLEHLMT